MSDTITLRQLRYLVALSRTLNFRRAAEHCGISQPSLSQQIKTLEDTMSTTLVERGTGHVALTPIGREVVSGAVEVLDRVDGLMTLPLRGPLSGILRFGVKATLGPYLLPHVVRRLHKTHPDLRLFIREDTPVDLERDLVEGAHDVVLAQLPIVNADIDSMRLFREPLFLAVAADHPLAHKKTFVPDDLAGLDFLTLSPRHHLHDQVVRLCEDHGAKLLRDYEGTSLDALRQMVCMGLGATFLPGLYVASEVRDQRDIAVLTPAKSGISRSIGLAFRKSTGRTSAIDVIANTVLSVAKEELPIVQPETSGL